MRPLILCNGLEKNILLLWRAWFKIADIEEEFEGFGWLGFGFAKMSLKHLFWQLEYEF